MGAAGDDAAEASTPDRAEMQEMQRRLSVASLRRVSTTKKAGNMFKKGLAGGANPMSSTIAQLAPSRDPNFNPTARWRKLAKVVGKAAAISRQWMSDAKEQSQSRIHILSKRCAASPPLAVRFRFPIRPRSSSESAPNERTTDAPSPSSSFSLPPPIPPSDRAEDRTEMDLMVLERLFHRMKFVKTLPTKQRLELGRGMQYLAADAGREIFRQGDVGNHFYVILSGSVEVLIRDPHTNANNRVATLYTGDSFGELALLEEGNVRAAGIVAREDSEFLTLGRELYNEILRTESQKSIKAKIDFMSALPLFSEVPSSMKQSLAYVLHEKDYPRNAVIVKQGAMVDDIFFVKEGAVRVVREVRDRRLLREKRVTHDGPGRVLRRARDRGMNDAPPEPPGMIAAEDAGGLVNEFEHLRGSTPPAEKERGDGLVSTYVQKPTELDPELARAERNAEKEGNGNGNGNGSDDDDADWRGQLGVSENGTDGEEEEEEEGGGGGEGDGRGRDGAAVGKSSRRMRASSATRSEAAAAAGLGRLYLEIGTLEKHDYFGDVVLARNKFEHPASMIAASGVTKLYVLSRWDLLRRVDQTVVDKLRSDTSRRTRWMEDERTLLDEFQKVKDWMDYRDQVVNDVAREKAARKALARFH